MTRRLPGRDAVPAHKLLFDVRLLKNPVGHVPHSGCAIVEPAATVYVPGGHLVCAMHESFVVLLFDINILKNPAMHGWHPGWDVLEPGITVYFPGGHFMCARQELVLTLLFDIESLKNPVTHISQLGSAKTFPAFFVYLPGGHLVWAVHSREHPIGKGKLKNVLVASGCESVPELVN